MMMSCRLNTAATRNDEFDASVFQLKATLRPLNGQSIRTTGIVRCRSRSGGRNGIG